MTEAIQRLHFQVPGCMVKKHVCVVVCTWECCYLSAAIFLRGFAVIIALNIWSLLDQIRQKKWGEKILFCVLTDVQINIKRCLSDGCDTRIHGLRAFGYQRVKKVGVSVCDASAIWYWSLLTSLVTASMETNPAFVHTILQNTQ